MDSRVSCLQINLHHSQATAANLLQLVKSANSFYPGTLNKDAFRAVPPDIRVN